METKATVSEIMTTDLETVSLNTTISEIRRVFGSNRFHHLPVMDENGRLAGIISKTDLAKLDRYFSLESTSREWTINENHLKTSEDIMTTYPITVSPEDSVYEAADIILVNRIHALPVIVNDSRLVGLVTGHDLLAHFCGEKV